MVQYSTVCAVHVLNGAHNAGPLAGLLHILRAEAAYRYVQTSGGCAFGGLGGLGGLGGFGGLLGLPGRGGAGSGGGLGEGGAGGRGGLGAGGYGGGDVPVGNAGDGGLRGLDCGGDGGSEQTVESVRYWAELKQWSAGKGRRGPQGSKRFYR